MEKATGLGQGIPQDFTAAEAGLQRFVRRTGKFHWRDAVRAQEGILPQRLLRLLALIL